MSLLLDDRLTDARPLIAFFALMDAVTRCLPYSVIAPASALRRRRSILIYRLTFEGYYTSEIHYGDNEVGEQAGGRLSKSIGAPRRHGALSYAVTPVALFLRNGTLPPVCI